jgi:hypothetical protein
MMPTDHLLLNLKILIIRDTQQFPDIRLYEYPFYRLVPAEQHDIEDAARRLH